VGIGAVNLALSQKQKGKEDLIDLNLQNLEYTVENFENYNNKKYCWVFYCWYFTKVWTICTVITTVDWGTDADLLVFKLIQRNQLQCNCYIEWQQTDRHRNFEYKKHVHMNKQNEW
jgi:hypothetical protein